MYVKFAKIVQSAGWILSRLLKSHALARCCLDYIVKFANSHATRCSALTKIPVPHCMRLYSERAAEFDTHSKISRLYFGRVAVVFLFPSEYWGILLLLGARLVRQAEQFFSGAVLPNFLHSRNALVFVWFAAVVFRWKGCCFCCFIVIAKLYSIKAFIVRLYLFISFVLSLLLMFSSLSTF